jgi:hypothetical protein
MRKTNPIWAAMMESQVPCGKELRNDSPESGRRKTKPICGLRADAGERVSAGVWPGAADIGPQGNRIAGMDFAFGVPRLGGSDSSFPPEGGTPNFPHQADGAHAIARHRSSAAIALSRAGQ